ncbi:unnamed protein product [Adineta ricciae]|uniref:RRM domain-containing protein n=1 Tax=Adineta ricciae TaxID=249248 RepID=A0A816GQ24_ADIRI|nr:unnamed protein product [Adineta ricciae]
MAHSFTRAPQRTTNTSTNQSLSIHVGNLSYGTNERDLEAFFNEKCGHVKRVRIIYDNNTQQSRGFAFVYFNTDDALNTALNLSDCRLDGRVLRISPAEARNSSSISTNQVAPTAPQIANKHRTQVVHCKKSKYDVYIGRPSDWGNPFVIGKDGDRDDVIRKYRNWIMRQTDLLARIKPELQGKRIACWCKPEACHGDVLAELADAD